MEKAPPGALVPAPLPSYRNTLSPSTSLSTSVKSSLKTASVGGWGNFPGGPVVVKTLHFQYRGLGWILAWRTKIPQAATKNPADK